jgi:hypothetical protein
MPAAPHLSPPPVLRARAREGVTQLAFPTSEASTRLPLCILLLTLTVAVANLLCFLKRITQPTGSFFSTTNLQDLLHTAASYTLFGLIAGLAGSLLGYGILKARSHRSKN